MRPPPAATESLAMVRLPYHEEAIIVSLGVNKAPPLFPSGSRTVASGAVVSPRSHPVCIPPTYNEAEPQLRQIRRETENGTSRSPPLWQLRRPTCRLSFALFGPRTVEGVTEFRLERWMGADRAGVGCPRPTAPTSHGSVTLRCYAVIAQRHWLLATTVE